MGKESINREFSRLQKENGIPPLPDATLGEYRKDLKQIARALEQQEAEAALNLRIESGEHALEDKEMPEVDVTYPPAPKKWKWYEKEFADQEAKKKPSGTPSNESQEPDLFSRNQE